MKYEGFVTAIHC